MSAARHVALADGDASGLRYLCIFFLRVSLGTRSAAPPPPPPSLGQIPAELAAKRLVQCHHTEARAQPTLEPTAASRVAAETLESNTCTVVDRPLSVAVVVGRGVDGCMWPDRKESAACGPGVVVVIVVKCTVVAGSAAQSCARSGEVHLAACCKALLQGRS